MGYRHKTAGIWNRGRHGRAEMSRKETLARQDSYLPDNLSGLERVGWTRWTKGLLVESIAKVKAGNATWIRMTAGGLDGVCEGELCGQGQGNERVEIVSGQQLQWLYARVE
nr:hypothetical protein L204_03898 [Cryptococcus depauperatus CBS 7855]